MKKFKGIFAVVLLSLALISCKNGSEIDVSKIEVNKESNQDMSKKLLAPKIELIDINGKKKTLEDLKGKIVIVNFFKTWNIENVKEIPNIISVESDYKNKNIEALFINIGEKPEEVKEFIKEQSIATCNILLDPKEEVKKSYNVESLPTTYIIDKDGYVFARLAKPTTKEEITNIIEGMLQ